MTRRLILTCLLATALLAPALLYAEHTHFWRQSDYSDFEKGTAKGVAIRSDGKLVPAPQFAAFSDPNLMYLWALRTDSRGRVYAAGGSDAKVLRLDDRAKPTTVFEAPELSAQTIVFDAHDNLYVGTSPDGKVYKVTPDGQKAVFFDPKAKYICALALDAQGTLFVGTGDKGLAFLSKRRTPRSLARVRRERRFAGRYGSRWINSAHRTCGCSRCERFASSDESWGIFRRVRNGQEGSHLASHRFQPQPLRRRPRRKAAPRGTESAAGNDCATSKRAGA